MGAQKGHPGTPTDWGRSNTDTQDAGATPGGMRASTADKEEGRSKAGEATRTGNQNGADGRACAWEAATTKGMAWPASPVATGCQGNPCSTGIRWGVSPAAQMGCVRNRSGSPLGQTSREGGRDIWWTVGTTRGGAGHLGLTHSETQRGRLWTACGQRRVDGKNSQATPATTSTTSIRQLLGATDAQTPHHATSSTAPAHWALRMRKQHQQEHRPQRPTESSDPTQHAKGRTGDCPGPRKETTSRRNVTQGGFGCGGCGSILEAGRRFGALI